MSSSSLIRQDLVPMIVGYALIMAGLATGLLLARRSPDRPQEPRSGRLAVAARVKPGWRRLAAHSLGTAVGGYLMLMVVIILYYNGVAPVAGDFVVSAFSGCAMLIGLAAPVFLALSWLADRKGWRL